MRCGCVITSELAAFIRRRAHERDVRIVHVELPVVELLRDAVARAEVHHVHRADGDDLGEAEPAGHGQPLGAGRVDPVQQRVGQLGQRVVDDALQRALLA